MASFEQTKWRGNQHLFDNIPAIVQDYARSLLDVPQVVWDLIVPKDTISVTNLIWTFSFPPFVDPTALVKYRFMATFFSAFSLSNSQKEDSGELVHLIRKTIVPPKIVVDNLLSNPSRLGSMDLSPYVYLYPESSCHYGLLLTGQNSTTWSQS